MTSRAETTFARRELARALDEHARAVQAMTTAAEKRAVAVFLCREAGVSIGAIAADLGVARPTVVELAKRGRLILLCGETPDAPRVTARAARWPERSARKAPAAAVPAPPNQTGARPVTDQPAAVTCRRLGCPAPALDSGFCDPHARY